MRLIDDLLDVSSVSQGKIELRKAQIDLSELFKTAWKPSGPLIVAGHPLSSSSRPPDARVWLDADLTRLSQVVSNLLDKRGEIYARGRQIVLSARRDGDEAVIAVSDNGVGIPADMLRRSSSYSPRSRHPRSRTRRTWNRPRARQAVCRAAWGFNRAESAGSGKGSSFRFGFLWWRPRQS